MYVSGEEEEQNKRGGLDDRIERWWSGGINMTTNETNGKKPSLGRMKYNYIYIRENFQFFTNKEKKISGLGF